MTTIEKQDELYNALDNTKLSQVLWDWFMDNMNDCGVYAGDAMPEDYIDIMTDRQIAACYEEVILCEK